MSVLWKIINVLAIAGYAMVGFKWIPVVWQTSNIDAIVLALPLSYFVVSTIGELFGLKEE